jgi:hypothetical protein
LGFDEPTAFGRTADGFPVSADFILDDGSDRLEGDLAAAGIPGSATGSGGFSKTRAVEGAASREAAERCGVEGAAGVSGLEGSGIDPVGCVETGLRPHPFSQT